MSANIWLKCEVCSAEQLFQRSVLAKKRNSGRFCSMECRMVQEVAERRAKAALAVAEEE